MPSKKKSNRQSKKPKHFNHHSSPSFQFNGNGDLKKILRDQNGRCGDDSNNNNDSPRPNSEKKCVCLVVEEDKGCKKKKEFSPSVFVSAGHNNQMEGSLDLQETQKVVEEFQSEDKEVIVVDEQEELKSIVESGGAETETLGGEDSNVLVESETVEQEAKEDLELLKENLVIPEKTDDDGDGVGEKEINNEVPSGLANTEDSRETEEAVETLSEDVEFSAPPTDVAPPKEETTILEADVNEESVIEKGIEEPKLQAEEEKDEESSSLLVQESSKEQQDDANESSQPLESVQDVETNVQEEMIEAPRSTDTQTNLSADQRQHYTHWSSCCGLFDFLQGRHAATDNSRKSS